MKEIVYLAEPLFSRGRVSVGLLFLASVVGVLILLSTLKPPPGGDDNDD